MALPVSQSRNVCPMLTKDFDFAVIKTHLPLGFLCNG